MDLTNKTLSFSPAAIRFSQSAIYCSQVLLLSMLITVYPGTAAHAGGKIFKTIDSQGNVTFTDVPLLLEPQLQRGLQNPEKLASVQQSRQSRQKLCESARVAKDRPCQHKPN